MKKLTNKQFKEKVEPLIKAYRKSNDSDNIDLLETDDYNKYILVTCDIDETTIQWCIDGKEE